MEDEAVVFERPVWGQAACRWTSLRHERAAVAA